MNVFSSAQCWSCRKTAVSVSIYPSDTGTWTDIGDKLCTHLKLNGIKLEILNFHKIISFKFHISVQFQSSRSEYFWSKSTYQSSIFFLQILDSVNCFNNHSTTVVFSTLTYSEAKEQITFIGEIYPKIIDGNDTIKNIFMFE